MADPVVHGPAGGSAPLTTRLRERFGWAVVAWSALTIAAVLLLAAVHVDDRYGVGAASGVWMGLAAAAHSGVWYPPLYSHGFYGGTRYMPAPVLLELAGRAVSGEYLVSAKALIYAVNVVLYVLVYRAARRQGAPAPISLAIVATVLASSAATTTALGFRWDALATALQLAAVELVGAGRTTGRATTAGVLCGLAVLTKVTSLWGPAAIAVWLVRAPRRLAAFAGAGVAAIVVVGGAVDAASSGRMLRQLRDFTFAGSAHSTLTDGVHRFYQLGLRNERSLPLLVALAVVALAVACAARRVGLYELGLAFSAAIVIVVLRDFGAYENHLIDFQILCGLVVAGLWRSRGVAPRFAAHGAIVAVLFVAFVAAARYTLGPDVRAALSHALHGRRDARYALRPAPSITARGTCALFEDASIPILAGQRPLVLDAFITHRLQTKDPPALAHLLKRVDAGTFSAVALSFPLTNVGWFQTLDFGSAFADAMRAHYRLATTIPAASLYVYTPRHPPRARPSCPVAPLVRWR